MLSVAFLLFGVCHYAECRNAECRGAFNSVRLVRPIVQFSNSRFRRQKHFENVKKKNSVFLSTNKMSHLVYLINLFSSSLMLPENKLGRLNLTSLV
jgi:hypothetical protein